MGERIRGGRGGHGCGASRGASLVEMVVVLAIASVLLGVAWPAVAGYLEGVELRSATLRFASAVARGRIAALSEGRVWQVRVADARSYVVAPVNGSVPAEQLPGATFFAGATSGGDVRFFPTGLADNATFTLGAGSQRRSVIVNQRGKVTIE